VLSALLTGVGTWGFLPALVISPQARLDHVPGKAKKAGPEKDLERQPPAGPQQFHAWAEPSWAGGRDSCKGQPLGRKSG
jgi:hypothetical protein